MAQTAANPIKRANPAAEMLCSGVRLCAETSETPYFKRFLGIEKVHRNSIKITVDLWRRAWDSNPRTVFGRQTISSRSRYDLFDSPPYISTVFRALRKCKKNTQEQYEILKFDPAKTLINQGFSAEKTARANAHFESVPL